jgi:hypothetical protein
MIVDATECPIQRPCSKIQEVFYSGKKKKHTMKYEIGISIQTGLIVWLGGGVSGAVHDMTIAKDGLLQQYPDKLFISDKGYFGNEQFITPFKSPSTEAEQLWNSILRSLRVSVEHTYGRIKIFHCLNTPWRHNILSNSLSGNN